jgi:hypothetical protein
VHAELPGIPSVSFPLIQIAGLEFFSVHRTNDEGGGDLGLINDGCSLRLSHISFITIFWCGSLPLIWFWLRGTAAGKMELKILSLSPYLIHFGLSVHIGHPAAACLGDRAKFFLRLRSFPSFGFADKDMKNKT